MVRIGFHRGLTKSTYSEPVDRVRVGGVASTTGVLLVTGAIDDDGVLECSYVKMIGQPRLLQTFRNAEARLNKKRTYPSGKHPGDACRRYRCPASFR